MMESLYRVFNALTALIHELGYGGIIIGMALESSAIPFPSEVVIPPAGALAHEGKMSLPLIIVCGGIGSLLGALLNYFVALSLGRPFFMRYGKWVLVTEDKIKRAEVFFATHGAVATFTCRFIPVLRQLVSLPAGFARMDIKRFSIYTAAGSTLWCAVLAYVGYAVGAGEDAIMRYQGLVSWGAAILAGMVVVVWGGTRWHRQRAQRSAEHGVDGQPSLQDRKRSP